MSRTPQRQLEAQLTPSTPIIFLFFGGLLVLTSVIMVIAYEESMKRIKKFAKVFSYLFRQRQSLTPRIKIRPVEENTQHDLSNIFDV